jgi:molybdate transport system substrate-binding protein
MRRAIGALLAVAALSACAGGEPHDETLRVFAAASLTDAFEEIAEDFEAASDGVTVEFNFAGSSDLAVQITEGAPADVFASANEKQMEAVGDAVPTPELFASNTLTIVVPADNPAGITGLADLASSDVTLVTCAPEVPCGAATATLEETQGVDLQPVSEEANVTDVLGKVASGEADAGIVYVTDIARGEGVTQIELAGAAEVLNYYPIGVLADSENSAAAAAFVEWVLSEDGQSVLASYGFAAP